MIAPLSATESITPPPRRTLLWRSGVHALFTSIIAVILAVVVNVIIARALGSAGKGSYDLALTTAALLAIAVGFSLPVGITYVVARGRANLRPLAWQLTGMTLLFGVIAALFLFALRHTRFATSFIPTDMGAWAIPLIVFSMMLTEAANYWRAMLNGRQEIVQANRNDLLSRAGHVLLLLIAIVLLRHHASPAHFIVVNIVALILTNLIFLKTLHTALQPRPGASGLREITAYSFTCYLSNFTQFLNYRLDVFIVTYFAGLQALGLYTLAVSLGQMIWLISKAAATVLLPNVAALQDEVATNTRRTAQITRVAFGISLVGALLLALFAAPIVPWLFGEEFRSSVTPLLCLLPGIAAFSAANVIASYLAGAGKPHLNFYVSLAGLIITVALDLLLIPRFNIIGAAIASTLSYVTSTVAIIYFFVRASNIKVRQLLWPTREDVAQGISLLRALVQR
jgi:O-antigen/teichoic acid export membrane protein